MRPLEILFAEHALVARGLDLLDRVAEVPESRYRAPSDRLLDFFNEFLDEHHHSKEEGQLFPALAELGIPAEGGPIAMMLCQHERGRVRAREMRRALAAGDDAAFAEHAVGFSALLRHHIEMENEVLFPAAEQVLSRAVVAVMTDSWARGTYFESSWREELARIERALAE